jgi:hypothetical protein
MCLGVNYGASETILKEAWHCSPLILHAEQEPITETRRCVNNSRADGPNERSRSYQRLKKQILGNGARLK